MATSPDTSDSHNQKNPVKDLFTKVMMGKWSDVLAICKNDVVGTVEQKPFKSGDTVLHVAVTEAQVDTVKELVGLIRGVGLSDDQQQKALLRVQNDVGDTALHLAASMGSLIMCRLIAGVDPSLVGVRNKNGETPLFLAALHGKSGVFLYLNSLCDSTDVGYSYSRREDGDTFLHCAIAGEYMDLAYTIFKKYQKLVDWMNVKGYTPLHVLATKPRAFESSEHDFHPLRRLLYALIRKPTKLKAIPDDDEFKSTPGDSSNETRIDVEKPRTLAQTDVVGSRKPCLDLRWISIIPELTTWIFEAIFRYSGVETMVAFIEKIKQVKLKHAWSIKIVKKIIIQASMYAFADPGQNWDQEEQSQDHEENPIKVMKKSVEEDEKKRLQEGLRSSETEAKFSETAILVAAKNGITEIVDQILGKYPVAINDTDASMKNIVMLAAENKRERMFKVFLEHNVLRESIVQKTDINGNTALHAAAMYDELKPWPIAGPALQMQGEILWFQFMTKMLPYIYRRNNKEETPQDTFDKYHKPLVKVGAEWLKKTSESCSVVAALIAGVAYATSSSIPGGTDEKTGKPKLEGEKAFDVFAFASVLALFFSVNALTMFLTILTSRYQQSDFARRLPLKLLVGLTSLFVSIASMLVSFSAAHPLFTKGKVKHAVFPVYAVACLPALIIFAIAQFPLYFDLVRANCKGLWMRPCPSNLSFIFRVG